MASDAVHRVCSMGGQELKFRYISSYRDHYRVIVRFHGMYLSCRDPLAIIYRGVLIFFRVTVEIWYPLLRVSVMTRKG